MSLNLVANFQGAWSNTTSYQINIIQGAGSPSYFSAAVVTASGVTYILNGTKPSTIGLAPASDSAWSVFAPGSTGTNSWTLTSNLLQPTDTGVVNGISLLPTTASKGSLTLTATANTGNTLTSITNAAFGQATALTIPDPAASTANFLLNTGAGQIQADSTVFLDKGVGTEVAGAVTINHQAGTITSVSLTTAAGASHVITLTNSKISASSVVSVTYAGGTNTTVSLVGLSCVPGSGTATITIYNNSLSTAFNGTVILGFIVV